MWIIPFAIIAVATVALDQISKILVLTHLYESQLKLIPNIFHLTYVENRGMAFGLLADHRWVFLILSVVGIALMGFYLYMFAKTTLSRISLSLIIGGGIGNMIDRVRLGFVVDFLDFCAFPRLWSWVFNIADAAVCVGAALFMFDLIVDTARELIDKKSTGAGDGGGNE